MRLTHALTDDMITDIVHDGFVGMRVENLGAPAVACFVSIDLCAILTQER